MAAYRNTAHRRPTGHRGFTLVEMLVVIGIIALIGTLVLAATMHSRTTAIVIRTKSDLALLETALSAYKQDFGDYPRFDDDNSTHSLNLQMDRGARLLCRALLSPGPAVATGSGDKTFYGPNVGGVGQGPDGADGPGFRIRAGNGGHIYPPYVQTDKVKLGNSGAPNGVYDNVYFTDATFLDSNGHTILYYPATPGVTTISGSTGAFVCTVAKGTPQGNGNAPLVRALYNGFDNSGYGETGSPPFLTVTDLQYILGDRDNDGYLATGRTATTTQPFLLWTAGADGLYGRDASGKSDDVCNFDLPADLRK